MREEKLAEFVDENGHFSTMFDFAGHLLTQGEHGWYDAKPVDFKEWREGIYELLKDTLRL